MNFRELLLVALVIAVLLQGFLLWRSSRKFDDYTDHAKELGKKLSEALAMVKVVNDQIGTAMSNLESMLPDEEFAVFQIDLNIPNLELGDDNSEWLVFAPKDFERWMGEVFMPWWIRERNGVDYEVQVRGEVEPKKTDKVVTVRDLLEHLDCPDDFIPEWGDRKFDLQRS